MTFDDLSHGQTVFLDGNVFVYHFAADPVFGPACSQLLQQVQRGDLEGYTSTHILSETAHRLMTIEASVSFGWPFAGIAQRLKRHRAQIAQLSQFRTAVDTIVASTIRIVTIVPAQISAAALISQQTGLLSNDALIVALMQHHGLTALASADEDFDNIPGISRHAPE